MKEIINFFGSLLVLAIAIGIFLLLMKQEMPESNRELLISFVSVMFGAVAASMHKITGADDNQQIRDLEKENAELKSRLEENNNVEG